MTDKKLKVGYQNRDDDTEKITWIVEYIISDRDRIITTIEDIEEI